MIACTFDQSPEPASVTSSQGALSNPIRWMSLSLQTRHCLVPVVTLNQWILSRHTKMLYIYALPLQLKWILITCLFCNNFLTCVHYNLTQSHPSLDINWYSIFPISFPRQTDSTSSLSQQDHEQASPLPVRLNMHDTKCYPKIQRKMTQVTREVKHLISRSKKIVILRWVTRYSIVQLASSLLRVSFSPAKLTHPLKCICYCFYWWNLLSFTQFKFNGAFCITHSLTHTHTLSLSFCVTNCSCQLIESTRASLLIVGEHEHVYKEIILTSWSFNLRYKEENNEINSRSNKCNLHWLRKYMLSLKRRIVKKKETRFKAKCIGKKEEEIKLRKNEVISLSITKSPGKHATFCELT